MKVSSLLYYSLGFAYMVIAAQIFYLSLKIDDMIAAAGIKSIHYTIWPSVLIVIGLTLIGAGIMLLSDRSEYTIAKLLAASGLVITISGIGMGLEFVARWYYQGYSNIVIVPIYVTPQVSRTLNLNITMFGGLILLLLGVLPAATFVVTEYERMMSVSIILLNAGMISLATLSVMLIKPWTKSLAIPSAITLALGVGALALLDIYRALRTIPAE